MMRSISAILSLSLVINTISVEAILVSECGTQLSPSNGTDGSRMQQLVSVWVGAGCTNITISLTAGQFAFDATVTVPPRTSLIIVGASAAATTLVSLGAGILIVNNCSSVNISSLSVTGSSTNAIIGTADSFVATFVEFSNTTHAIKITSNNTTLSNCSFIHNGKGDGSFGAVSITTDFVTINSCTFSQNIARVAYADDPPAGIGAGLALLGTGAASRAIIKTSIFHDNNAFAGAGAVCAEGLSLTVESSEFSNNLAGPNVMVWGGAIGFRGPTLAVINSQFFGNTADCGAPAIAAAASEAFYIYNCSFAVNTCSSSCKTGPPINGTVVFSTQSVAPSVSDSTFLGNTVLGRTCPDIASGDLTPHTAPPRIPWPSFTTHSAQWGWRASDNVCKASARASAAPGSLRWAKNSSDGFNGPVIGTNDVVYVTDASSVYALDGRNGGAVLWQFFAYGGSNFAPALGPDGTVFVCGLQFTIALDGKTGSLKWNFSYPGQPALSSLMHPWTLSSPVVGADGTVFIEVGQPPGGSTIGGFVVALWGATGEVRWSAFGGGGMPGSINGVALGADSSGQNTIVVFCTYKWWIQACNYSTGEVIWSYQFELSYDGRGTPAIVNGVVYAIAQDKGYHTGQVPTIAAFVNGPPPAWTLGLSIYAGGAVMTSPAVAADGTVFVASVYAEGSFLTAIQNGNIVWNASWAGADPAATATLSHGDDGVVYIRDTTGAIAATDVRTGKIRWETDQRVGDTTSTIGDIAIGSDGALYVCSSYGISVFQC